MKASKFLLPFEIIPFDSGAAEVYSIIRSDLEKRAAMIGPNVLIIASTVLSNRGCLVTNNIKEFSRIPSLEIEN